MPNWVKTKIKFTDITDEQFDAIVAKYCTEGEYGATTLDFEKLIPMPTGVFRGNLSQEDRAKYPGDLNWYDWSIKYWGTKWNASWGEVNRTRHELRYQTAWDYAEPPVQELADRLTADGVLAGSAVMEVYAVNEDIACGAKYQYYDADGYLDGEHEYGTDEFWEICEDLWGITQEEWEGE